MPIYEYRCECGAVLESLERVGTVRERCGELCAPPGRQAARPQAGGGEAPPERGTGRVQRVLSAPGIRGDGREASAPSFDPVKRAARPYCDCDDG